MMKRLMHVPPAVFTLVTDGDTSDYGDTTEDRTHEDIFDDDEELLLLMIKVRLL